MMLASTFVVLPVIQLIFAITAYRIAAVYKMERRPPLFLQLSVFIIPVVAGCVSVSFSPLKAKGEAQSLRVGYKMIKITHHF